MTIIIICPKMTKNSNTMVARLAIGFGSGVCCANRKFYDVVAYRSSLPKHLTATHARLLQTNMKF